MLKRKGKFKPLSGVYTKEAALDIGAGKAATTLAATFKIEKAAGTPTSRTPYSGSFARYGTAFRGYKISHGRKVPLQDTYIQKRGTRLMTMSERRAIQQAKISKPRQNYFKGLFRSGIQKRTVSIL